MFLPSLLGELKLLIRLYVCSLSWETQGWKFSFEKWINTYDYKTFRNLFLSKLILFFILKKTWDSSNLEFQGILASLMSSRNRKNKKNPWETRIFIYFFFFIKYVIQMLSLRKIKPGLTRAMEILHCLLASRQGGFDISHMKWYWVSPIRTTPTSSFVNSLPKRSDAQSLQLTMSRAVNSLLQRAASHIRFVLGPSKPLCFGPFEPTMAGFEPL